MAASSAFDLLITGGIVACCDEKGTAHAKGAVGIKDGRIAWVGDAEKLPADAAAAATVDAAGKLLAPGLVNAHCHLADSLFRGLVEDLELEDWLQVLWRAEGTILNEETNLLGARLGLAELALSGVTTVLDMFWFPETAAQATKKIGLRMMTGGFAFDLDGADGMPAADRLKHAEAFIERYKDDELVTPNAMVHGAYTSGTASMKAMHELAQAHGCNFHIHAAETRKENETVLAQHGARVVPLLEKLGMLGPDTLLAHAIHLDDADLKMVADSGTAVVHNPVSNLKLGSGFARVPEMLARGIPVGLGTDGAVSGNDIDMWLALRLAATMHRAVANKAGALSSKEALRMATLGSAQAMGMAAEIGSIETGKRADLMLLDLERPHAVPLFDPHSHLVYSACKGDVEDVWVGGRPVVAKGQLVNDDLGEILEQTRRLQPQVLASINGGD
ncbi:MAG: amidohydrolase [Betaproteobacteria bacterium AqS2]|uniref:Amidohydrolase n=1 Tax=Candidatus Amphirhobacter heronislandensis TaxID=1732024 RepID=A0A930UFZ0_9GAMM|nr:amidohydrolase [Betaproteobacteria bacterium AqS2]